LQRVGGLAVKPGGSPIVTAASGKVTLRDPRWCTVAPGW
jgi:hypothetical protein